MREITSYSQSDSGAPSSGYPGHIRFPFRFTESYRLAARPFGVTPANAWVEVSDRALSVWFGRWLVQTPLENITAIEITGPYRFIKTAGPARLGITDRGLTFATNGDRGVCMTFDRKVWGIDRLGLIRHPNLTVTVGDVDRLAEVLSTRAQFAAAVSSLRS